MIIDSIGVENYLSHRESKVSLGTGLNILVGKNGAGKSSILEAMLVALYGIKSTRRGTIISYGQSSCRIWVKFKHNGHVFHVERAFENKNGTERMKYAFMKINGEPAEDNHSGIIERLAKELGMGQDALTNSLFIEQGQIDSLITDTPAKRKENFNEIIQLNGFERAIRELDPIIKSLDVQVRQKTQLEEESEEIRGKIQAAEKELKSVGGIIKEQEDDLSRKNSELDRIKAEVARKEQILNQIKELRESLDENKRKIAKIDLEIKELKNSISQIDEFRKQKSMLAAIPEYMHRENLVKALQLLQKRDNLKTDMERNQKEKEKYKRNMEQKTVLENELKPFHEQKKEMEKLELEMESMRKENEDAIRIIEGNRKAMEQLMQQEKEMKDLKNTMHPEILKIDISSIPSKIKELQGDIERIVKDIEADNENITKAKSARDDLSEKINRLSNASICPLCGHELEVHDHSKMIDEFNAEKREKEEIISEKEAHKKALETKKKKLDDLLKDFNSSSTHRYISTLESIGKLNREINEMKDKVDSAVKTKNIYEKKQGELQVAKKNSFTWEAKEREFRKIEGVLSVTDLNKLNDEMKKYSLDIENVELSLGKLGEGAILANKGKTYDDVSRIERKIADIDSKLRMMDSDRDKLTSMEANKIVEEQALKKLAQFISDKEKNIQDLDSLRNKRSECEANVDKLRKELEENKIISGKNSGFIKGWKEQLDNIDIKIQEIRKAENAHNFLLELKRVFGRDGIPRYLRDIAVQSITSKAREIVARFNLSIEDIRISEDLGITITQDGNTKDVSQLSGGERVAVAIALRLAISKYLGSNISTVIMDEPTIYLDDERKTEFRDIIQNSQKELYSEGIFPQMIVITHDKEMYDGADVAYEIMKNDGVSKIVNLI